MNIIHGILKNPGKRKKVGMTVCGREFRLLTNVSHDLAVINCEKCLEGIKEGKIEHSRKQSVINSLDKFIGDRIRLHRKEAKLNQKEFGAKLGMSQVWVSNVENGTFHIDPVKLAACADVLGRKVDDFLPLADETTKNLGVKG